MKKRKEKEKLDFETKVGIGVGCGAIIFTILIWLGGIALNIVGGIVTTYMWNHFATTYWNAPEISVWFGVAIWLVVFMILRAIFGKN